MDRQGQKIKKNLILILWTYTGQAIEQPSWWKWSSWPPLSPLLASHQAWERLVGKIFFLRWHQNIEVKLYLYSLDWFCPLDLGDLWNIPGHLFNSASCYNSDLWTQVNFAKWLNNFFPPFSFIIFFTHFQQIRELVLLGMEEQSMASSSPATCALQHWWATHDGWF